MPKNIRLFTTMLSAVLFCGVTLAQEPVVNIDKNKNGNLAEAQRLVVEANRYVVAAQKLHHMGGHAEKARQLMVQVNQELKVAAEAADAPNAAKEKGKK
jgi:hypothetical protein